MSCCPGSVMLPNSISTKTFVASPFLQEDWTMKYFSLQDLITKNQDLRKTVSEISVAATKVQKQAAEIREKVEAQFADIQMPKQDKINAINRAVRKEVDEIAAPHRDAVKEKLREMEGIRLELEAGRDLMTNPISYLNAVTASDPKLSERRLNAGRFTDGAYGQELQTLLAVARGSNDVGMLAAIVSANDRLPTKQRIFSNATAVKDFELPGFADVNAVYNEVQALPQYAIHASRALDKGGEVKGSDRIARGLASTTIETNPDGSLASLNPS